MKVIIGLGNPGTKYSHTRHNFGFLVLDQLAKKHGISLASRTKWKAEVGEGKLGHKNILLVKPQTFMNLSGEAVSPILHWHKLSVLDLLVIHDDLDTAFGEMRLREKGRSGGHNGLESLITHLGTEVFSRLKIGIGRPPQHMDPSDFVLSRFSVEEEEQLPDLIDKAIQRIEEFVGKR
jgi:peptidyl-tRNA hydrolase, PTH1 family